MTGVRVLDLTQVLSGPYCTMLFADMGADVLKVEPPSGDVARKWGPHFDPADDTVTPALAHAYGGYFASINRNKRSTCLDLTLPDDVEIFLRLIDEADIIVENYRVGVMDRFGLSYEELHKRNPRLVYVSIRGFGDPRTGVSPYADWPAFDIIAQAMGGIMGITGESAQRPLKVGPGVGDIFPAALAAVGALAALVNARATGEGQFVDVGMYDSVLALTERIVYQHSMTGEIPTPHGNTHPLLCPYGVVRSADGFVAIASPTDNHWRAMAGAMRRPDLASDGRLATNVGRVAHADEVYAAIEAWSTSLTNDEVIQALQGLVPCGPVNTAAQIATDPHVHARSMIVEVGHPSGHTIDIVGAPIKFSRMPSAAFTSAPLLGADPPRFLDDEAAAATTT